MTSPSFYLSLQILLFILLLSLFFLSLSSSIPLSFALYPFWTYSKMFNYLITWWTLAECKRGRIVLMTNQAFSILVSTFQAELDGIVYWVRGAEYTRFLCQRDMKHMLYICTCLKSLTLKFQSQVYHYWSACKTEQEYIRTNGKIGQSSKKTKKSNEIEMG